VSATQIVFSYGRDLWTVPRAGGDAMRLTSGPGVKANPRFSPDGSQIAFTGSFNGNDDVYVLPLSGGAARRLTYHPGPDVVAGWTPDGTHVLFASSRANPTPPGTRLFTIPLEGGFPAELPLPMAVEGSYSPDAGKLAYVTYRDPQTTWKRYRGGAAARVRIADLRDLSVLEIPGGDWNDFNPMWAGGKIFFLSDRNGPVTLFSYDTGTRKVEQAIENRGLDFKSASAGEDAIVCEQFGSLHVFDLKTGKSAPVVVRIADDLPDTLPRFAGARELIEDAGISPNGARAVFEVRGEIVTVPVEKGAPRNLTNSPGVRERGPAWSPDGNTIAYLSDESGDYQLHLRSQSGMGEAVKIALGGKSAFYSGLNWSPDSKKIAYLDNHLGIWYVDLDSKKSVLVDVDYYSSGKQRLPAWSPDGQWLAYRKQLKNHLSAIFLYRLAGGAPVQVTDGASDVEFPVFDRGGRYLYFTASVDAGPSMQPDMLSHGFRVSRNVYVALLPARQPSPFGPESDEEVGSPAAGEKAPDAGTEIDPENIQHRIVAVPMPARNYMQLAAGTPGILYAVESTLDGRTVYRFDVAKRQWGLFLDRLESFRTSFNGKCMLYKRNGQTVVFEEGKQEKFLDMGAIEFRVDPRAEWRQMYHEVWRMVRDCFFDPSYRGLDLQALERRYEGFLDRLASRQDLNYLFTEMLGQLGVSHVYVSGGDLRENKVPKVGLLGADYAVENGRYRFTRIYVGESWYPELAAPLSQPGFNVAPGEYLLRVNGRELTAKDNIYSFFEGTVGTPVALDVASSPSGAGARRVVVTPVADEVTLRYVMWVEDNRRLVSRRTNDRVAYLALPDTSEAGSTLFIRYFFAQTGKEALIVDDRSNQGGSFATDIIEYLQRTPMSVTGFRDGANSMQPQGAIFGPKVMIANELAVSGGDAIAWYFQRYGVGKLIGKRTTGGLLGISSGLSDLVDGGTVKLPGAWFRYPDGSPEVENRGVAPDIEVDLDPKAVREGRDPQLEKAIETVMAELEKHPAPPLLPPANRACGANCK
jgi:tricorn protease